MRPAPISPLVLDAIVTRALEEDTARGDLTSASCVPEGTQGSAEFSARQALVVSGQAVVATVFRHVDPSLRFEPLVADGVKVDPGQRLGVVQGEARAILLGERVALNFMQRMSAVATQAHRYVSALPEGARCRIADTRKTTPGLRAFERYAVRCGGAHNHRDDLSSAVLIKDNHIAAAGGVRQAIENAKAYAPHTSRIECEVDTFEQLHEALEAGVDILMLDNFDDAQTLRAVEIAGGRCLLEASGGITIERIPALARAGVDVISVGALTHSAPSVDIGLDWRV